MRRGQANIGSDACTANSGLQSGRASSARFDTFVATQTIYGIDKSRKGCLVTKTDYKGETWCLGGHLKTGHLWPLQNRPI
jgi:hypothetical protein